MSEGNQQVHVEAVALAKLADALHQTRPFAETNFDAVAQIGPVERVTAPAGSVLTSPGEPLSSYWLVLEGEVRAERPEPDGARTTVGLAPAGEGFGETPLLTGKTSSPFFIVTTRDSELVRFTDTQFWTLVACCPKLRAVVLQNTAQRMQTYQVEALHREKLVSLGTLAAGLMHELHNPGTAAKRAAGHLRENLLRLQELSLRIGARPKTQEQMECMNGLLAHSVQSCRMTTMSSLEQADAEEAMGEWLADSGVANAHTIAPVLVDMGFDRHELDCAKEYFDAEAFSDALNWLGALISSLSQVCAIEESITRISDLVMAVKKFAYDEKAPAKTLDVHDSLQSTLTILGHKLRLKQITVEKKFDAQPPTISTRGSAISQVWTNLIDNAADASAQGGSLEIATWTEPDKGWLAVSIADQGSGIPAEVLPHIFEPFFTTKPQGSGTGLGLEIVHRIVTQKFGGTIEVTSQPGRTQFVVRLPLSTALASAAK